MDAQLKGQGNITILDSKVKTRGDCNGTMWLLKQILHDHGFSKLSAANGHLGWLRECTLLLRMLDSA